MVLNFTRVQETQEKILAKLDTLSTFNPETQTVIASNMRGNDAALTSVPDYTPLVDLLESRSTLNKDEIANLLTPLATGSKLDDVSTAICSLLQEILTKV